MQIFQIYPRINFLTYDELSFYVWKVRMCVLECVLLAFLY